jgi:hypothetical protein
MTSSTSPTCWIIAGPNGAGKTTFALQYLPQVANCRNFINADPEKSLAQKLQLPQCLMLEGLPGVHCTLSFNSMPLNRMRPVHSTEG